MHSHERLLVVIVVLHEKIKNTIKKLQKSGMSGIRTGDRQLQWRQANHWDTW